MSTHRSKKAIKQYSTRTPQDEEDHNSVVGLLAAHAALMLELAQLQQSYAATVLAAAVAVTLDHTQKQERRVALEAQIERIVRRHPEWFADRRSLVTPCGTAKLTATTKLDPVNEQLSIALIEKHHPETAALYLRHTTQLNLEALAALDDAALAQIQIRRVTTDSFSVVPLKSDLGKAVAAAALATANGKEAA